MNIESSLQSSLKPAVDPDRSDSNKLEPAQQEAAHSRRTFNFIVNDEKLKLATISCFFLSDKSVIRKFLVQVVLWPYTEYIVISLILINAILLGAIDYTKDSYETTRNSVLNYFLVIFQVIFLLEASIKMLAFGIAWANRAYLQDAWNILDFAVVVSIILFWCLGVNYNWTILRTFRLLGVLLKQNIFPIFRNIVGTTLKSLLQIFFVLLILMIIIMMFSLVGVTAFSGVSHYHCRTTPAPVNGQWEIANDNFRTCGGDHKCPSGTYCGSLLDYSGIKDSESSQLNYGITNYDSIGYSILATFQTSSLEGWVDILNLMQDGYSLWFSGIYYVACTIVCGLFAMYIVLPVLQDNYFCHMTKTDDEMKTTSISKKLTSTFRSSDSIKGDRDKKLEIVKSSKSILDNLDLHSRELPLINFCELEFREKLGYIESVPFFNFAIAIIILFNDCVQASDSYENSKDGSETFRDVVYYICLPLFLIEIVFRMIAKSKKNFFKKYGSYIDLIIIVSSVIQTLITGNRSPLLCLRTFRVISFINISKYSTKIVKILDHAVIRLFYLVIVTLLILYIYAIIGSQFFAGKLKFNTNKSFDLVNGVSPRTNYDTVLWSLLTTFTGLLGDNWFNVMYLSMKACGGYYAIFHCTLFIIGKIYLVSFFIAITLSLFRVGKVSNVSRGVTLFLKRRSTLPSHMKRYASSFRHYMNKRPSKFELNQETVGDKEEEKEVVQSKRIQKEENEIGLPKKIHEEDKSVGTIRSLQEMSERGALMTIEKTQGQNIECKQENNQIIDNVMHSIENEEEESLMEQIWNHMKNSSLFIFHRNWAFRVGLAEWVIPFNEEKSYLEEEYIEDVEFLNNSDIQQNKNIQSDSHSKKIQRSEDLSKRKTRSTIFDSIILVFILISIVMLLIDQPLDDPNSDLRLFLKNANIFITCVFALEAILKIIAMGFIWSENPEISAYILNGWNILDFVAVITSVIDVFSLSEIRILKSMKAVRALRVLRPLQASTLNEQIKLLITSLVSVIPNLIFMILITFFYLFSIGIITTYYFKGRVYSCSNSSTFIETKEDCLNNGGSWTVVGYGFDNIGNSLLSLIQMIAADGWVGIMFSMIDAREENHIPLRDNEPIWSLFAVIFMLFGHVFLLSMYLCILFECFSEAKLDYFKARNCNLNEQQWISIQRFMLKRSLKIKMSELNNSVRVICYELAEGQLLYYLDILISLGILILYSIKHYQMSEALELAINIVLLIFMLQMNIYCLIKLIGYGFTYFQHQWNQYEIIVLIMGDVGSILFITGVTEVLFTIVCSLRMATVVKLLQKIQKKKIKVIVDSIVFIIPSLVNFLLLIFVLLIIYSIWGISLFCDVKYQGSIGENANFRSFGAAMYTLIRCMTGEGWNAIMHSLVEVDGECSNKEQTYEEQQQYGILGCGTYWAYPYFLTYVLFVILIALKLIAVIVIESYFEAVSENYSIITAAQFEKFIDKWSEYDPSGSGWIPIEGLIYLMFTLDPPLGMYDEKLRLGLWKNYLEISKKEKPIVVRSRLVRRLVSQIDINEEFLLHKYESFVIERYKVMLILKELSIPLEVGTWRAHFRDVCQRMTIRAITNKKKEIFEIEDRKAERFFKQQWLRRFPEKRKRQADEEIYAHEYWAGHLVFRIFRQKIEKRKERDEKKQMLSRITEAKSRPLSYNKQAEFYKGRNRHLPPI